MMKTLEVDGFGPNCSTNEADALRTKLSTALRARLLALEHAGQSVTRILVVDGLDECLCFAEDAERAPFVIFDVDLQSNIAGPFSTREQADQHRLEILSGHEPRLDQAALTRALHIAESEV